MPSSYRKKHKLKKVNEKFYHKWILKTENSYVCSVCGEEYPSYRKDFKCCGTLPDLIKKERKQ